MNIFAEGQHDNPCTCGNATEGKPASSFAFVLGWMKKAAEQAKAQRRNESVALWEDGIEHLTYQSARIAELEAEIDQLRVQLADCGVAAMCNTEESREQQKCIQGDYGWSASYQSVVDATGREIELQSDCKAMAEAVETAYEKYRVLHIMCEAKLKDSSPLTIAAKYK